MMKQKITIGSILAAFLMISMAFISPVSARESGTMDVVNAIEHIEDMFDDENIQQYIEQLLNDEELIMLIETIVSVGDNAQLENLLQEFTMVLESNPAYNALTSYIDNTYGPDFAVIQAFSQEATMEDVLTVMNSVVSAEGTTTSDTGSADFSATEEDSSSSLTAPENGEENLGWTPVVDPDDDITVLGLGDLYPVYAPFLGIDPYDLDGDGLYESDVQTIYAEGYEGPIINIVGADVYVWINAEDKIGITIPGDLYTILGPDFDYEELADSIFWILGDICFLIGLGHALLAFVILYIFNIKLGLVDLGFLLGDITLFFAIIWLALANIFYKLELGD